MQVLRPQPVLPDAQDTAAGIEVCPPQPERFPLPEPQSERQPHFTSHPDIGFRLHDATLYNSLFRSDDEMLVNTHVYGIGACMAPVLHLRRLPGGGLFDTYARSVEQIWGSARPVTDDDMVGA